MPTYINSILKAGALAFVLGGCATELKVDRYFDQKNLPVAGAPYYLSFTQYEVTVSRRLAACESKGDPKDPVPIKRFPNPYDIQVAVKVDIKSAERRDPMRNYVIDLESLDSFFKTTGATVAYYDSGAIKSLNASAEDKTGEMVVSTLGAISKLVTAGVIGTSSPFWSAEVGKPSRKPGCSDDTKKNLARLKQLEKEIESHSANVDRLTNELTKLNALFIYEKERSSKSSSTDLKGKRVELMNEMDKLTQATKEAGPLLKLLSETHKIQWPNDGETFGATSPVVPSLDRELYQSWLVEKKETKLDSDAYDQLERSSTVYLKLNAVDGMGRVEACGKACPDDKFSGFKYRMPAQGQLLACSSATCEEKSVHGASDVGAVSQLGHVYVLPLKSAMFSKKSVSATFAENGMPTSIGVASEAASEKFSAALTAASDLAATLHKTKSEKELNDLKAKTDLLKAKKDYADATAALQPSTDQAKIDATNAFKVDTDLMNANLANLNARKALDEANKLVGTP